MSELGLGVTPKAWLKRVLLYMQETRNKSLIPRRNLTRSTAEGARLRPKADDLMQQVPDDYGLEVVVGLLQATRHTVAVKRIEKVEGDDSGRRLVELKSHRSTRMITGLDDTDSARSKMEKKVPVSPTKPKIKTDDPLSP
ncbi:hypothetical protein Tco_0561883 [Tanacetum coccineum]